MKRNYEQKLKKGNNLKLLPLVATLKPTNSGEMNKIPAMSLAWCSCEEKRQIRNQLGWANNCHLAFRNQQTIVATVPTYYTLEIPFGLGVLSFG